MNWRPIDTSRIFNEVPKIGNVAALSPYSIPKQFRVYSDAECNVFFLEFRYISPDRSFQSLALTDQTSMLVGADSGRIFQLKFDVHGCRTAPEFFKIFTEAVEALQVRGLRSNNARQNAEGYFVKSRFNDMCALAE